MEKGKISVAFIGGLSNGKIAFDYLRTNRWINLVKVITYPDDHHGPRHESFPDDEAISKTNSANQFIAELQDLGPDLILVCGWSELLDERILKVASGGVIGFHPSRLPQDRGRSVLAWQIEEGLSETALSMFYYSSLPDGGDLIAQHPILIEADDFIDDVLTKVDGATYNLLRAYFPLLRRGIAPRRQQDWNEGLFRRLRGASDSQINWDRPAREIYNKIRAISRPYPGATGLVNGHLLKIWKAVPEVGIPPENPAPGAVIAAHGAQLVVACRNSTLRVTEYEQIDE